MIIGIDASRANRPNKTGTEWFSWHLIEEFKKIIKSDNKVSLYTNVQLIGDLGKLPANFIEKRLAWPPKYLWTQIRFWWELLLNPPDILWVPAHTLPLLPIRRRIKVIATVHDVGFKRFPELYKPAQIWYHEITMRRIKARANLILTISEFSKQEIIGFYGLDPKKIKVVHLAYDAAAYREQPTERVKAVKEKYRLASPYLLYVGRLEKKKNIANIVKAFTLARADHDDLKLVLAGSSGNQYEEIKKIIRDLKLEREIILPGYVDQVDLPPLIAGAAAFVFPTLYEGFGLPILEAMAVGTPVITSNTLPHTEVGGEAALYADPQSPAELADAIIKVLEDDGFRQSLRAKGLVRAQEFSWSRTAEKIYDIISN